MKIEIIAIITQLIVFTSYLIITYKKFGLVKDVSAIYYEWKYWPGKIWHTLTIMGIGFPLFAFINDKSPWAILTFLGGAGVILSGIAAEYKKDHIEKYHVYSIMIGIVLVLLGNLLVYGIWWNIPVIIISFLLFNKLKIKAGGLWVELIVFYSIVFSLLLKCLNGGIG